MQLYMRAARTTALFCVQRGVLLNYQVNPYVTNYNDPLFYKRGNVAQKRLKAHAAHFPLRL